MQLFGKVIILLLEVGYGKGNFVGMGVFLGFGYCFGKYKFDMKILIQLILFSFITIKSFGQLPNKAYYNYNWSILGGSYTYLVPSESGYYLVRNFAGMLAYDSFDTLKSVNGVFENKNIEASFSKRKLILKYKNGEGKPIKLNMKQYDSCDPLINQHVNLTYAWLLRYKAEKIAKNYLGENNPQWEKRKKHKIEPYNSEVYRSKNSVYAKTCFPQFKLIADSVYNSNIVQIEKFRSGTLK